MNSSPGDALGARAAHHLEFVAGRRVAWVTLVGGLFLLGALATYGRTLGRPLTSDAQFLTSRNAFVRDPGGIAKVWTRDFFGGAITNGVEYRSGYYRPVTNALFWLEYRVAGEAPTPYRVTQL
ncbi:MAG: hypothetical protein GTN62_04355, partial [Gemmatimonadales bacterium]|nr:hypothetical protein [Gemmatimonadales bacterium]NIN49331.1 hypothetical protein [Gemmatimonadales bacterium]NIP06795.1 hypothetical protein [Gemmatimonadales bacterium]NIS66402.1 hypothetical protein [Gemmatimonadales bacterium]